MDWISVLGVVFFVLFMNLKFYAAENPDKEVSIKGAVKVTKGIGKGVMNLVWIVVGIGLMIGVGALLIFAWPLLVGLAALLVIIFLAKVLL